MIWQGLGEFDAGHYTFTSLQHCLDDLIIPSFKELFIDQPDITAGLERMRFVQTASRPYTHVTDDQDIEIGFNWSGTPADIICLGHEVAHGVQALMSGFEFMPPLAREVCAFIGELKTIVGAGGIDAGLQARLIAVWHQESATYTTKDLALIRDALSNPERAYDYRMNYGIARLIAVQLFASSDATGISSLFASGTQAMAYLADTIETIAHGKTIAVGDPCQLDAAGAFDAVIDGLAQVFGRQGAVIDAFSQSCVVNQSVSSGDEQVRVNGFGVETQFISCSFDHRGDDLVRLSGAVSAALALRCKGAQDLHAFVEDMGRLLAWLLFEPAPRPCDLKIPAVPSVRECGAAQAILGLSSDALFPCWTGQIDLGWFADFGPLGWVQADGAVRYGVDMPLDQLRYWRSLGAFAIASLGGGDAKMTPDAFIAAHQDKARAGAASDHVAFWPWIKAPSYDGLSAIGMAIQQLADSPYHRQFSLSYYLPVEILPALRAGNLQIFVDQGGQPAGMVTWAWLSDAVLGRVLKTGSALSHAEWNCGSGLFFNDWITQPKVLRSVLQEMTEHRFPNEVATSLRRAPDGSVRRVNRWTGRNQRKASIRGPRDTNMQDVGCFA